jgi:hypothetical protein
LRLKTLSEKFSNKTLRLKTLPEKFWNGTAIKNYVRKVFGRNGDLRNRNLLENKELAASGLDVQAVVHAVQGFGWGPAL